MTDADGNSLFFEYDPNNKVIAAVDQEGRRVVKAVDLDGRPRAITDPNGNTVSYEYYGPEKDRRLKSQKDGIGRITQYDYDANGNAISVTDNLGRMSLTTYDELNRPTRIVGPGYTDSVLGPVRPVTRNTYDSLGRLTQVASGRTDSGGVTPANDVVTVQMTYQYDDFGRKIKETDALGRNWLIQYDVNNNPITITDAKGQVTQMTYGYGHQLFTRNANGSITTYTRNSLSQVTRLDTPDVTYEYGYDVTHRLQTFTDRRGNKILEYTYSPAGRLMAMEDVEGNRTDYEYDPTGRLTNIWAPNHESVAFMYDNGGRLVEKWFPNGVNAQYTYNADNTLQKLTNRHGSGPIISQHDNAYDGVGNRNSHTELINGTTNPYTYGYDALNRLTTVTNAQSGAVESYIGRRRSRLARMMAASRSLRL